jgi:hypothetical protein
MPATAARIAFITQQYRVATAGPDSGVVAKYGSAARDTDEPVESLFDDIADVQAICDERHAILKADRRRIQMAVSGEATALALAYSSATPTARVIDDERALDKTMAVVEFAADFDKGQTNIVAWG